MNDKGFVVRQIVPVPPYSRACQPGSPVNDGPITRYEQSLAARPP